MQGRARRFSDLDLAPDVGRRPSLREEAALADASDEGDLPWRVDAVDLVACAEPFRRIVAAQAVPLPIPDVPPAGA